MAQLVEHDLAKVGVAGSSPVSRFFITKIQISVWRSVFFYFIGNFVLWEVFFCETKCFSWRRDGKYAEDYYVR